MSVVARVDLSIKIDEVITSQDLIRPAGTHIWQIAKTYASGTGASQQDVVWSDTIALAGAAQTIDLRGALTSRVSGASISFAEVAGFAVLNKSTTSGHNLTIGAGSNPWITWLAATGDGVVIGPGGFQAWGSPIDGAATTAGTGDILTLDPGANSFSVDVILWGRSA